MDLRVFPRVVLVGCPEYVVPRSLNPKSFSRQSIFDLRDAYSSSKEV